MKTHINATHRFEFAFLLLVFARCDGQVECKLSRRQLLMLCRYISSFPLTFFNFAFFHTN